MVVFRICNLQKYGEKAHGFNRGRRSKTLARSCMVLSAFFFAQKNRHTNFFVKQLSFLVDLLLLDDFDYGVFGIRQSESVFRYFSFILFKNFGDI